MFVEIKNYAEDTRCDGLNQSYEIEVMKKLIIFDKEINHDCYL